MEKKFLKMKLAPEESRNSNNDNKPNGKVVPNVGAVIEFRFE